VFCGGSSLAAHRRASTLAVKSSSCFVPLAAHGKLQVAGAIRLTVWRASHTRSERSVTPSYARRAPPLGYSSSRAHSSELCCIASKRHRAWRAPAWKEGHRADWQGLKQPYQEELTPSMGAIRAGCHHAIRLDDGFHHGFAEAAPS